MIESSNSPEQAPIKYANSTLEFIFGQGDCFETALKKAGYEPGEIGTWLTMRKVRKECERLGLKLHDFESSGGNLEINGGQPLIVLYKTRMFRSHALYVKDFAEIADKNLRIIGIIELPKN